MMKQKEIVVNYTVFDSVDDLEQDHRHLLNEAYNACLKAYAPYSGFKVGAAVKSKDGRIITGNNQENAAYPSGLCAERVALFAAMSQGENTEISQLAITIKTAKGSTLEPVAPCGACRQVIAEIEHKQGTKIEILFSSETGKTILVNGIDSLLPFTFNSNFLPGK